MEVLSRFLAGARFDFKNAEIFNFTRLTLPATYAILRIRNRLCVRRKPPRGNAQPVLFWSGPPSLPRFIVQ